MDRFLATYTVEFPRPAVPAGWPLKNFEMALDHLLTEQIIELRSVGEGTGGVNLAGVEGIGVRDVAPNRREYTMAHDVRLDPPTPAQARMDPVERVRAFLAEALGITPRQWEGPWNIVNLTVERA